MSQSHHLEERVLLRLQQLGVVHDLVGLRLEGAVSDTPILVKIPQVIQVGKLKQDTRLKIQSEMSKYDTTLP